VVAFFLVPQIALAEESQINAGLLSDIWFSKLKLENQDAINIFGSFQNTSGQNLNGQFSVYINDEKINSGDFEVADGSIGKIEANWQAKVGEFDIKFTIDAIQSGEIAIATSTLVANEASLKIKINQKIDINYVKEVTSNVYNNTITTINNVTQKASDKLESKKTRESSGTVSTTEDGQLGSVAGFEYDKDLVDGIEGVNSSSAENAGDAEGATSDNNDSSTDTDSGKSANQLAKIVEGERSSDVIYDFRNKPLASSKNVSISVLQFIIEHWAISIAVFIFLLFLFNYLRRDE